MTIDCECFSTLQLPSLCTSLLPFSCPLCTFASLEELRRSSASPSPRQHPRPPLEQEDRLPGRRDQAPARARQQQRWTCDDRPRDVEQKP